MMKERLASIFIKSRNFIFLLVIGISFLLCLLTLHDMQTAQGVGLYVSMQLQQDNVSVWNLLVDCVGMLLLFLVLFLPCLGLKRLQFDSFFRFMTVYLAFIPTIRPASLVHLGNTLATLTTGTIFSAENPWVALLDRVAELMPLLCCILPLWLILRRIHETAEPAKPAKWQFVILCAIVIFMILHLLFPALATETAYFVYYMLLILCFYEWEEICRRFPAFSNWGMILFGGCWLRGVYRMLELMSISNL